MLKPPTARWFVLASTACPAAKNVDLCASVVAAAYWLLRESMEKGLFVARKIPIPRRAKVIAIAIRPSLAFLSTT